VKKIGFYFQSPWTNAKNGKFYPLCKVEIVETPSLVFSAAGNWGIGVTASVQCFNGKTAIGTAVCSESDMKKYSFELGCRKALDRALKYGGVDFTPKVMKHIWAAFNGTIEERKSFEAEE
jgi:hypothetical protein